VAPGAVTRTRASGTSAGRILVRPALDRRPGASLLDLLGSGVAGVDLARAGGTVGIGGQLRIRGTNSLLLSQDPLVFVDGIRAEGTSTSESVAFGGSGARPSRIDDFRPEEIESIEVLKGPAAAAAYGGEAANGVILITTRRPASGLTRFQLRTEAGATWLANPEGRFPLNYYTSSTGEVRAFNVLQFNRERGFPDVFSTGVPLAVDGSVSGGGRQLRYYVSADVRRDESYLDYSWRNRYAGRANLSWRSSNGRLEVAANMGVSRARTRSASGTQPITTSIVWSCPFPGCEPVAGPDSATTGWNGPGHGYQFYRPEDYAMVGAYDRVTRTTANLVVNHQPLPWLRHRLEAGPDLTRDAGSLGIETDPTGRNPFFAQHGTLSVRDVDVTRLSIDYSASADWRLGNSVRGGTIIGVQRYSRKLEARSRSGNLAGTVTSTQTLETKVVTRGAFLRQEFSWRDRVFLDGGVHLSENLLGEVGDGTRYDPSAGLSWVVIDRQGSSDRFVSGLRLRAGWGRVSRGVGELPFELLLSPAGPEPLRPERVREIEVGLEARLLRNRIGVDITGYDRRTTDVFLPTLAPPSGGLGSALVNDGTLGAKGIELALDWAAVRSRTAGLDLRTTLALNRSRVIALDRGPRFYQVGHYDAVGFAPGSYFFRRVVSATVVPSSLLGHPLPTATDVRCQAGTPFGRGTDEVTVPCDTAPLVYSGQPSPSWFGSLSATLTLGEHLRLFGLVDYRGGHTVLVGDAFGAHAFFLTSKAALEGDPIVTGQRVIEDFAPTALFNGGFARLRSVSVGYLLPRAVSRWVGASAGSLVLGADNIALLWRAQKESFGEPWVDPEAIPNSPVGGDLVGLAQDPLPQPARVRLSLHLEF
jgi:TonB-dependent SusC/RagA subfamily outer membrane receptor